MTQRPEVEYHAAREAQHRAMARQAADVRARQSHDQLAMLHAARARDVCASHDRDD